MYKEAEFSLELCVQGGGIFTKALAVLELRVEGWSTTAQQHEDSWDHQHTQVPDSEETQKLQQQQK